MQLLGEFAAQKVALIVPGQGINTSSSNPASALLLNMLGAIAQFEHSIIVERVNAGLAAAKRRGVKLGRPELSVFIAKTWPNCAQRPHGRAIAEESESPAPLSSKSSPDFKAGSTTPTHRRNPKRPGEISTVQPAEAIVANSYAAYQEARAGQ